MGESVEGQQSKQKSNHDCSACEKTLSEGSVVYVRNFGTGRHWLHRVIKEVTGPVSFLVQLPNGELVRHHQDHL